MNKNPINEIPEEKFKRVAEARTNSVIHKLRVLGNLSNRHMYNYTEKEINKIFAAINKQVRETKARFISQKQAKFKL